MADRKSVCEKIFVLSNGDEVRHAQPEVERLEFRFADGEVLIVNPAELPESIQFASMVHGLSQKIGDSYAGKSGDEANEAAGTIIERLTAGEWIKAREGVGPRPSMVIDAVVAALIAAGQEVDEARRDAIAEKVKGKEGRKAALEDPRINAEYERLRAERQTAKAAAAAAKAAGAEGEISSLFE